MNPFLIRGYKGAEYFCDRDLETKKIVSAIKNGQDITLYGYRRLGKSALIHHIFNHLSSDYHCVYIDIWGSLSVKDFTKEFANSIINSKILKQRKFSDKLIALLRSMGASFTINKDGLPNVSVVYNDRETEFQSLQEVFSFVNSLNIPVVIAIDEFQEIRKYDDNKPFEAKLRSLTQISQNIQFIYSGSEKHILTDIFTSYKMPFYQSSRMMSVGKILRDNYVEFAKNHLKKGKKAVDDDVLDYIMDTSYLHTFYTQSMLNLLYGLPDKKINLEMYIDAFEDFIDEKSVFYTELPERLTKSQFLVLKAIANEGQVNSPSSGDFLSKAGVKNASSMHRSIRSLLDKQLILKEDDHYRLYDVFLECFIKFGG